MSGIVTSATPKPMARHPREPAEQVCESEPIINIPGWARSRENSVCMIVYCYRKNQYYCADEEVESSNLFCISYETHIHSLVVSHAEIVPRSFAIRNKTFDKRYVLEPRIHNMVASKPEPVIAKDTWLSERVILLLHALHHLQL
jgi:hypothetical protein